MRIPRATYRLQLNPDFGYTETRAVVDYLDLLGISDLYLSPIFKARTGSMHGYDVVDPARLNPQLGTEREFAALVRQVKSRNLGWLQDVVPNHMAYHGENWMLMDVLENGEASEYFRMFDIDWDHTYESMKERLLAPFLGAPYGEALARGEIRLQYLEAGFRVRYYDLSLPLRIDSYVTLLSLNLPDLKIALGSEHPDFVKLIGILYVFKSLSSRETSADRYDRIRFAKSMLWECYRANAKIHDHIDNNLQQLNDANEPKSAKLLNDLLFDQFFRLSYWKVASEEINYRRFFSVNELISMRVEDSDVLQRCHRLIFHLIKEGVCTGLRIDHIDGLYDPTTYLKTLRKEAGEIYLVVEKILAPDEDLSELWPVQGTTGYDFLNHVNGIFCRKQNARQFNRIYAGFTGSRVDFEDLLYSKKEVIIERFMTGDVDNLAHHMKRISSRDRGGCDITLYGLKRALYEVLALFPVYRTYINSEAFSEVDQNYIAAAVEIAARRHPDLFQELDYLKKFLLLRFEDYLEPSAKRDWLHFVMRFQQFTGPLMAKGFEDTTLYVYNRLTSLNEVGGDPHSFGISLQRFHEFNETRCRDWAHTLNATSTHDTKRGEDVRARINVLSEIPDEWAQRIKRWREINARKRRRIKGTGVPSRNDEYFFYQTLIGAYPAEPEQTPQFQQRIKDYIIKAIREAKDHTGWVKVDEAYENAFMTFIERVLDTSEPNPFLEDFVPFQARVAHYGVMNSLSQTLLKITSPGIPDFYQGTELWELSLVDPDNRRPVDFKRRKALLRKIRHNEGKSGFVKRLLAAPQDGRIKFFLTYRGLQARRDNKRLFAEGNYLPLETSGRFAEHLVAFARNSGSRWAVTIAPRFPTRLVGYQEYPLGAGTWEDTRVLLPANAPSQWQDAVVSHRIVAEGSFAVADALAHFPVALLLNSNGP